VKQGSGTLNLNGATNTASGVLAIDNGVVNLGGGNVAFASMDIGSGVNGGQSANNATLRVTGTTAAYTPNVVVNAEGAAGTRTIDFANTSGTATLSGSVTLEKAATVAVAPGGIGNIGGAVTGNHLITKSGAGTVVFNNTVAGPVTVTAGTLGGNTTISGLVTLNSGGTLAPGNSVGTMTFNGGLNLSGGNVTMEIAAADSFDSITVTGGNITYGGTLYVSLGGFTPAHNSTYKLFTGTRGGSSQFDNIFFSNSEYQSGSTFNYDTGTLTVVPEPSTWVLIGVGAAFVLWRLRRRKA
jgi:autotransporter-associated beta strand protein